MVEELSIRKAVHRLTVMYVLTEYYLDLCCSSRILLPKSEFGTSISSQGWVPEVVVSLAKLR